MSNHIYLIYPFTKTPTHTDMLKPQPYSLASDRFPKLINLREAVLQKLVRRSRNLKSYKGKCQSWRSAVKIKRLQLNYRCFFKFYSQCLHFTGKKGPCQFTTETLFTGVGKWPAQEDQQCSEATWANQRKPCGLQFPKKTAGRLHLTDVCMAKKYGRFNGIFSNGIRSRGHLQSEGAA